MCDLSHPQLVVHKHGLTDCSLGFLLVTRNKNSNKKKEGISDPAATVCKKANFCAVTGSQVKLCNILSATLTHHLLL